MKWEKLGIVWEPSLFGVKGLTHAMVPTPLLVNEEFIRVFVTCLNSEGIGKPYYVDLDPDDPSSVLGFSQSPILEVGEPGNFDDNGLIVTSVLQSKNGHLYMYYAGFELCKKIRYRLLTGGAISKDGGRSFSRIKQTPLFERSQSERFFRGGAFITNTEEAFSAIYVGGGSWTPIFGKDNPVYDIREMQSSDGENWPSEGEQIIKIDESLDEIGFGRPWNWVSPSGKTYLYYSIRKKSNGQYRLGLAEADASGGWVRIDHKIGLETSELSFENEAIMYSSVLSVKGETYCFYNGNKFGEAGFALAKLAEID